MIIVFDREQYLMKCHCGVICKDVEGVSLAVDFFTLGNVGTPRSLNISERNMVWP